MFKIKEDDLIIMDKVEKEICSEFNVNSYALVDKDSSNNVSMARMYLFYILHYKYGLSIRKIATTYDRNIRAIPRNCSKLKVLLKQRSYKTIYDEIMNRLD